MASIDGNDTPKATKKRTAEEKRRDKQAEKSKVNKERESESIGKFFLKKDQAPKPTKAAKAKTVRLNNKRTTRIASRLAIGKATSAKSPIAEATAEEKTAPTSDDDSSNKQKKKRNKNEETTTIDEPGIKNSPSTNPFEVLAMEDSDDEDEDEDDDGKNNEETNEDNTEKGHEDIPEAVDLSHNMDADFDDEDDMTDTTPSWKLNTEKEPIEDAVKDLFHSPEEEKLEPTSLQKECMSKNPNDTNTCTQPSNTTTTEPAQDTIPEHPQPPIDQARRSPSHQRPTSPGGGGRGGASHHNNRYPRSAPGRGGSHQNKPRQKTTDTAAHKPTPETPIPTHSYRLSAQFMNPTNPSTSNPLLLTTNLLQQLQTIDRSLIQTYLSGPKAGLPIDSTPDATDPDQTNISHQYYTRKGNTKVLNITLAVKGNMDYWALYRQISSIQDQLRRLQIHIRKCGDEFTQEVTVGILTETSSQFLRRQDVLADIRTTCSIDPSIPLAVQERVIPMQTAPNQPPQRSSCLVLVTDISAITQVKAQCNTHLRDPVRIALRKALPATSLLIPTRPTDTFSSHLLATATARHNSTLNNMSQIRIPGMNGSHLWKPLTNTNQPPLPFSPTPAHSHIHHILLATRHPEQKNIPLIHSITRNGSDEVFANVLQSTKEYAATLLTNLKPKLEQFISPAELTELYTAPERSTHQYITRRPITQDPAATEYANFLTMHLTPPPPNTNLPPTTPFISASKRQTTPHSPRTYSQAASANTNQQSNPTTNRTTNATNEASHQRIERIVQESLNNNNYIAKLSSTILTNLQKQATIPPPPEWMQRTDEDISRILDSVHDQSESVSTLFSLTTQFSSTIINHSTEIAESQNRIQSLEAEVQNLRLQLEKVTSSQSTQNAQLSQRLVEETSKRYECSAVANMMINKQADLHFREISRHLNLTDDNGNPKTLFMVPPVINGSFLPIPPSETSELPSGPATAPAAGSGGDF